MGKIVRYWGQLAIATGLVLLNWALVVNYLGLSYKHFNWAAFAGVYEDPYTPENPPDSDNDGIPDPDDPRPQIFDPTGCFYDREDGRIVPGGQVSVLGPGPIQLVQNGSNGCYQFLASEAGVFTLVITPPARCGLALDCPDQAPPPISPANPTSNCCTTHGFPTCDDVTCTGQVCSIDTFCCTGTWNDTCAGIARDVCTPLCDPTIAQPGFLTDPNSPGFLLGGGACTPWFSQIELDYPSEAVIGNNIPLNCVTDAAPAPTFAGWAWGVAGFLLLLIGLLGVQRQRVRELS